MSRYLFFAFSLSLTLLFQTATSANSSVNMAVLPQIKMLDLKSSSSPQMVSTTKKRIEKSSFDLLQNQLNHAIFFSRSA